MNDNLKIAYRQGGSVENLTKTEHACHSRRMSWAKSNLFLTAVMRIILSLNMQNKYFANLNN
jgi:hypothetical protein